MHHFKSLNFFLILFVLAACGKPLPELNGIDLTAWKRDRNGCNGNRTKDIEAITREKEKLKALSEMDLVKLLGRPDENQLLTRNQKIYTYYLEPGPACENPSPDAQKLILRINAMGLAKETLIK